MILFGHLLKKYDDWYDNVNYYKQKLKIQLKPLTKYQHKLSDFEIII